MLATSRQTWLVIASNNTYSGTGAVWQRPQVIMAGRLVKVGAKFIFSSGRIT
jgi:hypothetical protein